MQYCSTGTNNKLLDLEASKTIKELLMKGNKTRVLECNSP